MSTKIQINSIDDLIHFIETNNISIDQIDRICNKVLGLRVLMYQHKKDVVTDLKEYKEKFEFAKEKPLFLGSPNAEFSIKDFFGGSNARDKFFKD